MYQYFDEITKKLKAVEKDEKDNIFNAAVLLAKTLENQSSTYIFGASHAGILTQEAFYRAGGLITMNPIFGTEIMLNNRPVTLTSKMERLEGYGTDLASTIDFQKNDLLFLHSVSGRNPVTIEMALVARNAGVKIIAITNLKYSKRITSRHSSGKKLYQLADIVIDNHGEIGDAMCKISGYQQKIAPSSTITGSGILNCIVVEACRLLANDGIDELPIFYSANMDGGDELNKKLFYKYEKLIHYSF
ncbi:sugar isomerase (sis) [Liquorilactobacillus ghanensis DSM 18630]|uniref:Sugar isomerase (Sis) n=1 Tax=Liquorilactobacillus ghanensis DSM 18630 TaxID=1423750 RepID=A0A0R1VEW3_9LACO|nr:SIS domain-containing protein [Liquorilactobacillus ghanensis]KRM03975.1 sugar isomerase (sis) [Liquorilactobacillus ghanensis DSM 18630]